MMQFSIQTPADSRQTGTDAALMLMDVASAKSALAQLQHACAAAHEEHSRTKTQLLSLQQQHQDVHSAVYKPDSSRPAAQQQQLVQALHTENLQLKACLRQEVEARQLLEKKHAELLDLLRSGRVLELLASGFLTSTGTAAAPASSQQQQQQQQQLRWQTSAEVYSRIAAADAGHCSDQALPSKRAASSDASTGMQPPGRTASSSSYTSSAADGDSSHQWQQPGHASAAVHMQPAAGFDPVRAPAHSAYFPAQAHMQQQPQLSSQRPEPCLSGQQPHTGYSMDRRQGGSTGAGMASTAQPTALHTASSPAAPGAAPLSSPAASVPTTWQGSLQSGLFAKLTQHSSGAHSTPGPGQQQQQQQHQFSTPPCKAQQQRAAVTTPQYRAEQHAGPLHYSTGFEVEGGLLSTSTSTSSSPSAQSGLLDSEDLDELAGLCDSLLQHRAAAQPRQPSPAPVSAGGCADPDRTPQQPRSKQQGLAGTSWFGSSSSAGMSQGFEQPQDAASQACVPGLQQLAAQLRQLQEQVSATAMDAAPVRGTSSNGGGSFSSGTTPLRQASCDHATQHASVVGAGQAGYDQHGSSSMQGPLRRGSTGSSCRAGSIPAQHGSPGFSEGPAMTSLQQQLAQRMAEVKERLSNICNGMLHDSPPPPAVQGVNHHNSSSSIPGSSSFFTPPASPPEQEGNQPAAAGGQSPCYSHPGTVQHAAGSTGRSASEPGKAAAGRLGAGSAWSYPAGQVGAGRYCAPQDTRAGNKQGHPAASAAAAAARGSGDADPAAAFAAIKASIHSNPDVPGFFTTVGQQQAPDARRVLAGGQRAGSRGGSRASGSGVPPAAAAAQASWASTDDAAGGAGADDSDEGSGSWATVDELDQQQQQQQVNMNEQHGQRTTTEQDVNSNAEERAASPVSCEGSALAGLGRVVFSPMKSAAPQSRRTRQQSE